MKERPILFSGPMVRPILDRHKTQTRRVLKPQPIRVFSLQSPRKQKKGDLFIGPDLLPTESPNGLVFAYAESHACTRCLGSVDFAKNFSPYGQPGDRLWVKETFRPWRHPGKGYVQIEYDCDCTKAIINPKKSYAFPDDDDESLFHNEPNPKRWIRCKRMPSIFMPRWASRITLEVASVRVERVQDIAHYDCEKEGLVHFARAHWSCPGTKEIFREGYLGYQWLWDSINGKTYPWKSNPFVWVVEFKMLS